MRRPLVAGNWKMNGSRSGNASLLEGVKAGMGEVKVMVWEDVAGKARKLIKEEDNA